MDIGEHVITCGAVIYLQEDGSHITIGRDSMIGWGVDIWCTDAHTIMDMEGNPTNHPHFIEIGEHVWVGKDVKIGKNVRIGRAFPRRKKPGEPKASKAATSCWSEAPPRSSRPEYGGTGVPSKNT